MEFKFRKPRTYQDVLNEEEGYPHVKKSIGATFGKVKIGDSGRPSDTLMTPKIPSLTNSRPMTARRRVVQGDEDHDFSKSFGVSSIL